MSLLRRGLMVSAGTVAVVLVSFALAELLAQSLWPPTAQESHEPDSIAFMLRHQQPCVRIEVEGGQARYVPISVEDAAEMQAQGAAPPPMPVARTPGVMRLAIVGESSAWLLGQHLQNLLDSQPCGKKYELLACGVPASAGELVERRFHEVLDYSPDAVIVLFGHNLHYRFTAQPERRLKLRLIRSQSRLLTLLGNRFFAGSGVAEQALQPRPTVEEWTAVAPQLADRYADPRVQHPGAGLPDPELQTALDEVRARQMFERIESEARARRVKLVLSTMASNRLFPPALESADLADPQYLEARYLHADARTDEALAVLRKLATDHERALWHFVMGDWLLEARRYEEARGELARALILSPMVARAPDTLNQFIRDLAARGQDALYDPARRLAGAVPDGVTGWEAFADNCHLQPRINTQEALEYLNLARETVKPGSTAECALSPLAPEDSNYVRAFLRNATSSLWTESENGPHLPWDLALTAGVARFLELDAGASTRILRFLDGPEWSAQGDARSRSRALAAIAAGFFRAGARDQAFKLNEKARAGDASPSAWIDYGLWLVGQGKKPEAQAAFEKALKLDPQNAAARDYARR